MARRSAYKLRSVERAEVLVIDIGAGSRYKLPNTTSMLTGGVTKHRTGRTGPKYSDILH